MICMLKQQRKKSVNSENNKAYYFKIITKYKKMNENLVVYIVL